MDWKGYALFVPDLKNVSHDFAHTFNDFLL